MNFDDMEDLEKVYEDKKTWITYEGHDPEETIGVYRRCPDYGRYLKIGELLTNMDGRIEVRGWICRKHGEVEPFYDRF